MITNSTARWVIFVLNIMAAILALVLWLAPLKVDKYQGAILFSFVILFLVDAFCVVPYALPARA